MKSKHSKSKKINIKKIVIIILIFAILISVCYLMFNLVQNNRSKNMQKVLDKIEVTLTETETERMLQVKELQKVNSEIVGWLEIDGTNINYPVLQGTDNSYYMTHDYEKKYTKNGSIFLDKDYDWNLPSTNLLLYGHNNKNGTMFQELLEYKEEQYYKKHPTIKFTTNSEDAEYEIIAVFLSRVYYKSEKNVFRYYYFINAQTEEQFNNYIENSKSASLYNTGKTAEYGDQLLTLSTCSYHTEDRKICYSSKKSKIIY